jgi:integrase-like protein
MSTTTVSPLRQRMVEDMSLRNFAPRTQEAYIRGCKKLAAFLRRSPDTATAEDIRLSPREHLHPQPYDDRDSLPVPGDAETA